MSLKRNRNAVDAEDQSKKSPFVLYGIPIPPQDSEARDDGSYVPIWKQEVTDERGRKRLHGAFTGGFSAGYFNTVGSKEGWTPATFKSSRAERSKAASARPEDFMDAEDLVEAGEAKKIETNHNFSSLGSTEDELARQGKQVTLMDLLAPAVQDTVGVKLLKKMGWKEGQGVGPKIRRKAQMLGEGEECDAVDQQMYLLAPANSTLVTFSRKTDPRGMGYAGDISLQSREKEVEQQEELRLERLLNAKPKKQVVKGGFGVGVLNDDGEDNDDPYEIRPKTAYNRTISGDKPKDSAKPLGKKTAKHVFISKKAIKAKLSIGLRKCHDDRLPLGGFVFSPDPIQSGDGWYPPPEIPTNWEPSGSNIFRSNQTKPKQQTQQTMEVRSSEPVVPKLDPRTRGSILGETPLPGKSVFDFMTPAARARIASVTGSKNLPQALGETLPSKFSSSHPSSLVDMVPKLDNGVALGALRGGFMPYSDDPDKKARYRTFLEVQAGLKEGLPDRKYGMNIQDWIKELNEFMGAARIFKPLTGLIATRFTSSTTTTSAFQGGSSDTVTDDFTMHLRCPQPKQEDSAEVAAKMSMYGPMTRSIIEFFPTRLLCKRFNVRPPDHADPTSRGGGSGAGGLEHTDREEKELVSKRQLTEMMREVKEDNGYVLLEEEKVTGMPKVDTEVNEALEREKAGEEVFKAIFGDEHGDDDDDDDDDV